MTYLLLITLIVGIILYICFFSILGDEIKFSDNTVMSTSIFKNSIKNNYSGFVLLINESNLYYNNKLFRSLYKSLQKSGKQINCYKILPEENTIKRLGTIEEVESIPCLINYKNGNINKIYTVDYENIKEFLDFNKAL